MDSTEQERYSRQIKLPQVGAGGQQRLAQSRALIIGMGGLGSPVALYLASAGIGQLTITDFDRVDESNLQRQIIHTHKSVGELKAASAQHTIQRLNPGCVVEALDYELDGEELLEQVDTADVVLDCTDNFPSRFELNDACMAVGTPLVSGAAIRWEGQVATFRIRCGDCERHLFANLQGQCIDRLNHRCPVHDHLELLARARAKRIRHDSFRRVLTAVDSRLGCPGDQAGFRNLHPVRGVVELVGQGRLVVVGVCRLQLHIRGFARQDVCLAKRCQSRGDVGQDVDRDGQLALYPVRVGCCETNLVFPELAGRRNPTKA